MAIFTNYRPLVLYLAFGFKLLVILYFMSSNKYSTHTNEEGHGPRDPRYLATASSEAEFEVMDDVAMFVRIRKTGSTTLTRLILDKLCPSKGLGCRRHDWLFDQRKLQLNQTEVDMVRRDILNLAPRPAVFIKHVHFFPMTPQQPLMFSVMRDPVERFVSRFKFAREAAFSWEIFSNHYKHCEPLSVANQTFEKWREKELNDCILSGDRECNMRPEDKTESQIAYICGQGEACTQHDSRMALQRAMWNADHHFTMIGILEELHYTMQLLEKKMPKIFAGFANLYNGASKDYKHRKASPTKSNLTTEAVKRLKSNFKLEYEFYDFVKQKFIKELKKYEIIHSEM